VQFGLKYNVEKNVDGILKLGNDVQLKHASELIREKTFAFLFNLLSKYSPTLIMEFAHSNRNNTNHIIADSELKKLGYRSYLINTNGGD
jgi:hypothetical protein